jgi:hypothetical protein
MKSGKFGIALQHGVFNWWQHFGCGVEGGGFVFNRAPLLSASLSVDPCDGKVTCSV